MPLAEFSAQLLGLYTAPLKAAPTRDKIRQALGQVMRLPGVEKTTDLTPATVAMWVRDMMERGLSPMTITGLLSNLSTACNFAVRNSYLGSNPVESRRQWLPHGYEGHPTPERDQAPTRDEATRLMIHLLDRSDTWEGQRLLALVATVLYVGRMSLALEPFLAILGQLGLGSCLVQPGTRLRPPLPRPRLPSPGTAADAVVGDHR
jgi:hypothetical protein